MEAWKKLVPVTTTVLPPRATQYHGYSMKLFSRNGETLHVMVVYSTYHCKWWTLLPNSECGLAYIAM